MAKRRTREELEREIARLQPHEELVYIYRRGDGPRDHIPIESGEWRFELLGADRACGGVILDREGHLIGFACDVAQRWVASGDVYLSDCAAQIRRAQSCERRSRP